MFVQALFRENPIFEQISQSLQSKGMDFPDPTDPTLVRTGYQMKSVNFENNMIFSWTCFVDIVYYVFCIL